MQSMALELDVKEKMVIHFLLFSEKEIIFETIFRTVVAWSQDLENVFFLEVPLIAGVIAKAALYRIDSNLFWKGLLNAWSKITSP